jgi:hypothetical protein
MNCFFMAKTRPGPCVVEISDMKQSKKGYCLSQAIFRQSKVCHSLRLEKGTWLLYIVLEETK